MSVAKRKTGKRKNASEPKGHGRDGSDAYVGVEGVPVVTHGSVRHGDRCLGCLKGRYTS